MVDERRLVAGDVAVGDGAQLALDTTDPLPATGAALLKRTRNRVERRGGGPERGDTRLRLASPVRPTDAEQDLARADRGGGEQGAVDHQVREGAQQSAASFGEAGSPSAPLTTTIGVPRRAQSATPGDGTQLGGGREPRPAATQQAGALDLIDRATRRRGAARARRRPSNGGKLAVEREMLAQ